MTRLRGRAPKGRRLDGTTACMTIAGATDTEMFRTYVQRVLCPILRPGDIVSMDNLGAHKSAATLALIEAAGAQTRFLPAYSPDLNPIKKMWSKIKARLRAIEARTPEQLDEAIGAALAGVTSSNARGWFASCAYRNI